MQITYNGAVDNQNNLRNLIRIRRDEIFADDLIAFAQLIGAYYEDEVTYTQFIKHKERDRQFLRNFYCIEIEGANKKKGQHYTEQELWNALSQHNTAL